MQEKRRWRHHFEIPFLKQLVEDKNSCVTFRHCTHHLALHPFHLNNVSKSTKDILNVGIAKYNQQYDAILLGYENIVLLSNQGAIDNDNCFIHHDMNVDCYLFKPEVGKKLIGIVSKTAKYHISCLVHTLFNVYIPKPKSDKVKEKPQDWIGSTLQVGQEVEVKVIDVDLKTLIPNIKAELISVLSELINQDGSLNTSQNNKIIFDDELSEDQDLFANNVATEENTLDASKIKKHKKRKIKIEVSDELLEVEETKTKKKKKQKSTEDEADFQEKVCETQNEAVMDTTSGTKKRKRSRSGDDVDGIKIKRKKHKGDKINRSNNEEDM